MPLVKICGLMNEEDTEFCCQVGVDWVGFIVDYPVYVPWNLIQAHAKKLLAHISGKSRSCVVTGGTPEHILALAENLRPSFLQLHYKETLEETAYLAEKLKNMGIQTIKALPVDASGKCAMAEFQTLKNAAKALSQTDVSLLLLDARSGQNPTHSQRLSTTFYREVVAASKKPVVLGGGLCSGNLQEILKEANPYAVDILSGAEQSPGVKNRDEIETICQICAHF